MKFKNLHKILIFLSLFINTIEAEDIYKVEVIIIKFNDVIVNEKFNNQAVNLLNPQGTELSNLRSSLIPNALETVKHNINRQNRNLKIFEIGNTYSINDNNYIQAALV